MQVYSIKELCEKYRNGELSPVEVIEYYIDKCTRENSRLNAFITILGERARQKARDAQKALKEGKATLLTGIPLAVKDIFYIKGVRCTVGSKILKDFVPDYTSTAVKKLEATGGVVIGTTNLHEFASGVTTVNPHYGATKNPWDERRIAGGSSGGSAAAVASGIVPAALGTDTSGSIRIPASLCGVYGLKPTYGLISRFGVFPLSKSLDHVGPIASTAWDVAILIEYLRGKDAKDLATLSLPQSKVKLTEGVEDELRVKRLKVPKWYTTATMQRDIREAAKVFIKRSERMGIEIQEIDGEYFKKAREVWAPIRLSEALAYHYEWYKSRPNDYGEDVLQRLKAGESYTAVDYIRAKEEKERLSDEMQRDLAEGELFFLPTVLAKAPFIGQKTVEVEGANYDIYTMLSTYTVPFNVTGLPALNIPAFLSEEGLPIGMQIAALPGREDILLNMAGNYERRYGLNRKL